MECYDEQFQTVDYGMRQKVLNIFSNCLLIFSIFSFIRFRIIAALIFLLVHRVIIIITKKIFVEYEYEITNNELLIVKILNKKKRVEIITIDIREIIEFKEVENAYKNKESRIIKVCLDRNNSLKECVIFTKTSIGIIGFHVALNERMERLIKFQNRMISV